MAWAAVATVKVKAAAAISLIIDVLPFQLQRPVMACLGRQTFDPDQSRAAAVPVLMRRPIAARNNAITSRSLRIAAGYREAKSANSQLARIFAFSPWSLRKDECKKNPASRGAFPYIRWCFFVLLHVRARARARCASAHATGRRRGRCRGTARLRATTGGKFRRSRTEADEPPA
jgi:hypothetical protein